MPMSLMMTSGTSTLEDAEARGSVGGGADVRAALRERRPEELERVRVVVDEKTRTPVRSGSAGDAAAGARLAAAGVMAGAAAAGSVSVKVAPLPGPSLAATTVPWCRSVM